MNDQQHSMRDRRPASEQGQDAIARCLEETDDATLPLSEGGVTQKRSFLKEHGVTVLLVAILLVGLGVLLYPPVSQWVNSRTQSYAVQDYNAAVEAANQDELDLLMARAEVWNAELVEAGGGVSSLPADKQADYESQLKLDTTAVMGTVVIDKINVNLPIYHGVSDEALVAGAGHLEGSSLPVGGESTHCVLMAHRGLPTSLLFTDLDRMAVGDTFKIKVLGETLYYLVDQILIVEPDDLGALAIEKGKDYCTLLTCTPYGVNTQRLLVRGVRTAAPSEVLQSGDARIVDGIVLATILGIALVVITMLVMVAWQLASTRDTEVKRRR